MGATRKLAFVAALLSSIAVSAFAQLVSVEQGANQIKLTDSLAIPIAQDTLEHGISRYSVFNDRAEGSRSVALTSTLPEILSRRGFSSLSRFSSFSPSFYLDGEEIFFSRFGSADFSPLPLEMINSVDFNLPLFSAGLGGEPLFASADFAASDSNISSDYTRISAHWGINRRQRLSGVMLKRLGRIGWIGLTSSETKGDNPLYSGDFKDFDYSPIAYLKYGRFDFAGLAVRTEKTANIESPGGIFEESSSKLESNRRIVDGKIGYSQPNTRLELRFDHQDEVRRYRGSTDSLGFDNSFYIDGVSLKTDFSGFKFVNLDMSLGSRAFKLDKNSATSEFWRDYRGSVSADISISKVFSALLAFRGEKDILGDTGYSFGGGMRISTGNNLLRANAIYSDALAPLQNYLSPFEGDDFLTEGESPETIHFRRLALEGVHRVKNTGAELSWSYNLPTGLSLDLRGGYYISENPSLWVLRETTPLTVEWAVQNYNERLVVIPASAEFRYSPDNSFEISCKYSFSTVDSDSGSAVLGMPEHRVLLHLQEGREYLDNLARLTLGLEGEAILGLRDFTGNEIDPYAFIRAEARFDYLSFSLFAFGEFLLVQSGETWENLDYSPDRFLYGTSLSAIPSWSIRGGLEWFFID